MITDKIKINSNIYMTQEEKDLLFKDLCARLPYDPFVKIGNNPNPFRISQRIKWTWSYGEVENIFDNLKPYLRPMSSMTKEEKHDCIAFARTCAIKGIYQLVDFTIPNPNFVDWLNKHHFDYRGLIEKGLAIKAPEGMYNI